MYAYDEDYLMDAQDILGHMMDFALNTCGMKPQIYCGLFIHTGIAEQFGKGNPKYIAGKNGCEIVRDVLERAGMPLDEELEDVMYLDKSPEYWAGWVLCYYQWFRAYTFHEILEKVPINKIIAMYYPYHEADITKFVEIMDCRMKEKSDQTMLKRLRIYSGLSQSMLAEKSGVNIRQIQLFEQRERNINKTSGETLQKLSKALDCGMEELLEK